MGDAVVGGEPEFPAAARVLDALPQGLGAVLAEGARALAEEGPDAPQRAAIQAHLAVAHVHAGDLHKAVAAAHDAVTLAKRTGAEQVLSEALGALELAYFLMGRGTTSDLIERAVALEEEATHLPIEWRPSTIQGCLLLWTDRFDEARAAFRMLLDRVLAAGGKADAPYVQAHLAEVECWTGDWAAAERLADEAYRAASTVDECTLQAFAFYPRACVDALLGRADSAREIAAKGLAAAEAAALVPGVLRYRSVLGFLELSLSNWKEANRHLSPLADQMAAMGMEEIGVIRFVPDQIETLIALGDLEGAGSLLQPFSEKARTAGRSWGRATVARCLGMLRAAQSNLPGAVAAMKEALAELQHVRMPFEMARTELATGEVQRMAGDEAASKEHLERALGIFNQLGAQAWVQRAIARVGEPVLGAVRPTGPSAEQHGPELAPPRPSTTGVAN